jgi:hypothetical protein
MESTLAEKSGRNPQGPGARTPAPKAAPEETRRRREAEALRQNLLRRKTQQRSRQSPEKP